MLENLKKFRLVLASNSPRRKELLAGLDVDYEVRVLPGIDRVLSGTGCQGKKFRSTFPARKRKRMKPLCSRTS